MRQWSFTTSKAGSRGDLRIAAGWLAFLPCRGGNVSNQGRDGSHRAQPSQAAPSSGDAAGQGKRFSFDQRSYEKLSGKVLWQAAVKQGRSPEGS